MLLERRVEDFLLDDLVGGQVDLDPFEQLRARLDRALGGRLELAQQRLELAVVLAQEGDGADRPGQLVGRCVGGDARGRRLAENLSRARRT